MLQLSLIWNFILKVFEVALLDKLRFHFFFG
jgi:hypothetical protein